MTIPADIMKTAEALLEEARRKGNPFVEIDAIASALLAERERCAKVAEGKYTGYYGDPSGDIAEAIRKGDTA